MRKTPYTRAFTLIEILLVIAILAILAAVVIIAINPVKQFGDARNTQRTSDVYMVLNAIYQYAADHQGSFPDVILEEELEICSTDAVSCSGMYDLSVLTDNEAYLIVMPIDPYCARDGEGCLEGSTGYALRKTENGRIHVRAPWVENGEVVEVMR